VSPSRAFDGYLPVGTGGGTPLPRSNGIMGLGRNSRQIFGFKGLRGKIFRNKELAGYSVASIVPLPPSIERDGDKQNRVRRSPHPVFNSIFHYINSAFPPGQFWRVYFRQRIIDLRGKSSKPGLDSISASIKIGTTQIEGAVLANHLAAVSAQLGRAVGTD